VIPRVFDARREILQADWTKAYSFGNRSLGEESMRNVDRWLILIGLLYGLFGFAFGIWVGINEHFEQAHLHAHINLIGFASMVLFGLLYRAYPALAESKLATVHFVIYTLGAIIFLAGIPLAQTHQTIVLAVVGSLSVLVGLLVFLTNFFLNAFSAKSSA
jgi:FtsH-binding integral membrane protein